MQRDEGLEFNGDNFTQSITGNDIPDKYDLKQNYPNPFNPLTRIHYDLPEDNFATIVIYDIQENKFVL